MGGEGAVIVVLVSLAALLFCPAQSQEEATDFGPGPDPGPYPGPHLASPGPPHPGGPHGGQPPPPPNLAGPGPYPGPTFICPGSGMPIPLERECNGVPDCPGGEDEALCGGGGAGGARGNLEPGGGDSGAAAPMVPDYPDYPDYPEYPEYPDAAASAVQGVGAAPARPGANGVPAGFVKLPDNLQQRRYAPGFADYNGGECCIKIPRGITWNAVTWTWTWKAASAT